ncbi:lasso peptide biosynthesis B2 protein [Clostridiaceae bacterium UIB06]|uniref:Lasso peptide biosynthesis B2 protein n=1 Tax=Clostridium thailandense TaxID=2794346 RepID=A0A949TPJ8_9CLOT|nr:lasso peptide biosynthesis B2 protein [Clostridium thailandense]MBV7276195.1 lasso peptide biosynthesis B2 protein [Clostridium thailandense]MCH5138228.1 lasso peptide biosynthesis B2 protein [Clostridiaceae bacterium UIB06]
MKKLYQFVKKLYKFFKISFRDKMILIEAFCITGMIRFAILFIDFSKIVKFTGNYKEESSEYLCETERFITKKVGWIVNTVSKNTPWESKCLVKALTAQILLKQKNISSTLYLGVTKNKQNKLIAHAWLRSGLDIITGEREKINFTEVAKFANHSRRKSL